MRCACTTMMGLAVLAGLALGLESRMESRSGWAWAAAQSETTVRELSSADRETLETYFGDALTAKAIPASGIADPSVYFVRGEASQWTYRVTHGKERGTTVSASLHEVTKDGASTLRFDSGGNTILTIRSDKDGNLTVPSSVDRGQKVISRYAPAEPLLVRGFEPGETHELTIDVGVFDQDDPDHESHKGKLQLAYTYVGAFEVTIPAGRFETILLRWRYKGNVGPASLDDVQYWFLAKGRGPVAMIERRDVSAMLFYQDHEKFAAVLAKPATQ